MSINNAHPFNHVPFQIYFICIDTQIQNFIKVQIPLQKKIKIKNLKKMVFDIFLGALRDVKEKKYTIIVHVLHFAHYFVQKSYFKQENLKNNLCKKMNKNIF